MTQTTNARIAGVTFLACIAAGVTDMRLHSRATAGTDTAGRLASIAEHAGDLHYTVLLGIVEVFCALVLGVTLYAIRVIPNISRRFENLFQEVSVRHLEIPSLTEVCASRLP